MSLVPQQGVLRKLYNDARAAGATNEYTSSAFWQVLLQKVFYEDQYIVVCEFPPNESLRRVDIVVRKFDEDNNTLSSIIFHEVKGRDGNAKMVETQALGAAKLAMERYMLSTVYTVTTIGTRFRVWFVSANEGILQPLTPPDVEVGSRKQYVEVDSTRGGSLREMFDLLKRTHRWRQPLFCPASSSNPEPARPRKWPQWRGRVYQDIPQQTSLMTTTPCTGRQGMISPLVSCSACSHIPG
ncbi:hypothetical protein VTK73DRAFT_6191 [Phialemonium thermophilum]|uniref:Uncharacterized protein n=1 Tax=Phialemonium thermophilum TaxID=223376 RepID=A0ABR3WK86_9PEZI